MLVTYGSRGNSSTIPVIISESIIIVVFVNLLQITNSFFFQFMFVNRN